MMKPSDLAYELVKHFEGMRLRAYKDQAGVWTIGYGHTNRVWAGMTIGEDEAESLLMLDMEEVAYEVNKMVTLTLTQYEFDALCSWVFNLGSEKTRKSTLIKKLNARMFDQVPKEFLRWNKIRNPATGVLSPSPGLTRRRKAEGHLFRTGELLFE